MPASAVETRRARDEVDRTGRGVLAEQRALRPAQHFEHAACHRSAARPETGSRCTPRRRSTPVGELAFRLKSNWDRPRIEILGWSSLPAFEMRRFGVYFAMSVPLLSFSETSWSADEGGDRNRHVLQALGALLRGNDHLFEDSPLRIRGLLGPGGARSPNRPKPRLATASTCFWRPAMHRVHVIPFSAAPPP